MKKKKLLHIFCSAFLITALALMTGCSSSGDTETDNEGATETQEADVDTTETEEDGTQTQESIKIGVAVYNTDDPEVLGFRSYYEDYIATSFDVEFLYSGDLLSAEDEEQFVEDAIAEGVQGIITFVTYDTENVMQICKENGIYYMMGSGTIADDTFEAIKTNPYFLGMIGPSEEDERQAGADMAAYFANQETDSEDNIIHNYLILSGGGAYENVMHQYRTEAVLTELAEVYGFEYEQDVTTLATSSEAQTMEYNGFTITICPGYLDQEEVLNSATELIQSGDYNVILSVYGITDLYPTIDAQNDSNDMQVGVIDYFSEDNLNAIENRVIHYVTGKYAAMCGPAFIAMYNAVTGYADDFRDNGEAFQIGQHFWTANDPDTYSEMYGTSITVTDNTYDVKDYTDLLKVYNDDASLEGLRELAEADTAETSTEE
ncbi:MAG: substrate-binding domain-containing protein [Clostridiales bacterium]|nr:substrate-binding domain-containing protein [Clostridiales bacterium]